MDVDKLLSDLESELRNATVEGSFFARVWIGAGLQAAADVIERKRIELLCDGILSDVDED